MSTDIMANKKNEEDPNIGLIEIIIPLELAQHLTKGELDINRFCRVCLNEKTNMISIFNDNDWPQLVEMFTLVTNIEIGNDDGLPPQICSNCKEQILNCYEFKQLSEKSDIIWKTSLKGEFVTKSGQPLYSQGNTSQTELNSIDNLMQNQNKDIICHNIKEESCGKEEQLIVNEDCKMLCKEESIDYLDDIESTCSLKIERFKEEFSEYYCEPCNKTFTDTDELMLHLQTHESKKTFKCSQCSKSFIQEKNLKQHFKIKHEILVSTDVSDDHLCFQCNKSFSSQGDLHIHLSVHDGSGNICNTCLKQFSSSSQLRRHLKRHMEAKKYNCDMCPKTFVEHYAMTRHRRVHTGQPLEKKYKCEQCDKRFSASMALMEHLRTHTGVRPCVCAECGQAFLSTRLLRSHMLTHSDYKRYKCEYCDKRFRHESTRNTHHRTHTGDKPYICSICGKQFIQNSNLTLHMRTHTGEKPYECTTCNRSFTALATLKKHELRHVNEKTHACPICGKKFTKCNLNPHIRRHNGDKSHLCTVCPKRFTTASKLKDHSRVHTGEKLFECNACNQKLGSKSHLLKHIQVHEKKGKKEKKSKKNNVLEDMGAKDIKESIGEEVLVEFVTDMEVTQELELHDNGDDTKEIVILDNDSNTIEVTYSDNLNFLPLI